MESLIKKLEAATEGSRELDGDIHYHDRKPYPKGGWNTDGLPHYTTSIDAALRLVPEGFIWDVASTGQAWVMGGLDNEQHLVTSAPTPALALCIAALKAREA